jgi:hypothetical protein
MFVSIVLTTEYMDYESRKKWYLKNLLHCKENGWALITHEYFKHHFEEIQETIDNRFLDEFEMRRFSMDEVKDVEQYFIPDQLFENKEKECGSRTQMLLELSQNCFFELENTMKNIIETISINHSNEKIEGVFHCLEGFESIRKVCVDYQIPLISYVFSAIRKVHGYRQTLFSANIQEHLYCSNECEKRYNNFLLEGSSLPVFDNRDIIAIFGKERTLPLISLLNKEPKYEICVCGEGYLMLPHIFSHEKYTDDDIHYECNKLYSQKAIRVRQHPMLLSQMQVDWSEMRNDPAAFILSCKRVTAICSQIVLKAMLWNRTAVMKKNTLPFSFMCEKNYMSESKVDLKFLNYYLFGYLIPSDFMFSEEYWKWRLTKKPTETEIYERHLNFYLEKFGLTKNVILEQNKDIRFKSLLEARGVDNELIDTLLTDEVINEVDFDVAVSKLLIEYNAESRKSSKTVWRLNQSMDDTIISKFSFDVENVDKVSFFPLDDKAGFVRIEEIKVKSKSEVINTLSNVAEYEYYPKNTGNFDLQIPNLSENIEITFSWKYKKVIDALK